MRPTSQCYQLEVLSPLTNGYHGDAIRCSISNQVNSSMEIPFDIPAIDIIGPVDSSGEVRTWGSFSAKNSAKSSLEVFRHVGVNEGINSTVRVAQPKAQVEDPLRNAVFTKSAYKTKQQ